MSLNFVIKLSSLSFLGLIFSQILFWQQGLKHQIELKVKQAYAFILMHQQFQSIEQDLSAICSILAFRQTKSGLSVLGQELVYQLGSSFHYPVLQGDMKWFESTQSLMREIRPHLKYLVTNLQDSQILEQDEFGEVLEPKLAPPLMLLAYREQHLDFKDHKFRLYAQGRPQTLVSGLSRFSVRILNERQLEWHLQFQEGRTFTWVVDICKNMSRGTP
jgi:hypothetical protein